MLLTYKAQQSKSAIKVGALFRLSFFPSLAWKGDSILFTNTTSLYLSLYNVLHDTRIPGLTLRELSWRFACLGNFSLCCYSENASSIESATVSIPPNMASTMASSGVICH